MQVEPWMYFAGIVVQVLLSGVLGAIAWFVRQSVEGQKKTLEQMAQRIAAVEKERVHRDEFERLSRDVQESVSKEEWLRDATQNRLRIEALGSKIDNLTGQSQAVVQVASAIAAALNRERTDSHE